MSSISLKVLESYTRDVGRGVARIDYDSMDSLNLKTGDIIEIKGKRRGDGRGQCQRQQETHDRHGDRGIAGKAEDSACEQPLSDQIADGLALPEHPLERDDDGERHQPVARHSGRASLRGVAIHEQESSPAHALPLAEPGWLRTHDVERA